MNRPAENTPYLELAYLTGPDQGPMVPAGKQRCDPAAGCGKVLDESEFYTHGNGKGSDKKYLRSICRTCENSRPRKATRARVISRRARQRATALLLEEYADRFEALLDQERRVAEVEYEMLGEAVVLKPGPRRPGQALTERIDVARCRRCHTNHDRGHSCPSCGHTEEESND